jgi:transketolase
MRRTFADELEKKMLKDDRIFLLTADLGYKMWDSIFKKFPDRAVNTGAAEQAMLDIAVGMAYDGKIPFCYSITPFLIYRPLETIRTYINHENLNVKLVGSGRDKDYEHDGWSHHATDVKGFLDQFGNIKQYWPMSKGVVPKMLRQMLKDERPSFISLAR